MKRSGMRRRIDDLGRVVIPKSIRDLLDLRVGEELEVSLDGERIVLVRPLDGCTFCGEADRLETLRGKHVCASCMAAIRAMERAGADEVPSRFGA